MKNPQAAEVHILDRMMYLLEENSVQHLVASDEVFGQYIYELYGSLQARAMQLQPKVA